MSQISLSFSIKSKESRRKVSKSSSIFRLIMMSNCRSSLYIYAKFLLMWHTQAPLQHDDLLPPFPHEPVGGLLLPPDPLGIVNRQLKLGISIKNFHLGSDCKPNQRFLFENYKFRKASNTDHQNFSSIVHTSFEWILLPQWAQCTLLQIYS